MTDETKETKQGKKSASAGEKDIRTLSAPVSTRVHIRLDSAQELAHLDKASLVRLAVRLMVKDYYKGNGVWQFPPELDFDMIVAQDAARCDYELPS